MSVLIVETSTQRDSQSSAATPLVQGWEAVGSISVCRPWRTFLVILLADIVAVVSALLLASGMRSFWQGHGATPISGILLPALLINLAVLFMSGLYPGVCLNPVEEMRRCMLSVTLSFFTLWSATFFLRDLSHSRLVYGLAFAFAGLLLPSLRAAVRHWFCRRPWWGSQVAILGYGESAKLLMRTLRENPEIGLKPIAVFDDATDNYAQLESSILRGPLSRCLQVARAHRISYGIVCMPSLSRQDLLALIDRYGQCFSHLLVIPNMMGIASLGICAREMGGIVGLEIKLRLLRPAARFAKRALDLGITIALSPVITVLVGLSALLIKLEDGGPALFANERIGKDGSKFRAWKLRSMTVEGDRLLHEHLAAHPEQAAHWALTQKLPNDPRITNVGRILRKTSIDELPQFWNVLVGQMSVVGPRPVLEHQIEMYGTSFDLYKQVRPGITGLWQVSGRNELTFHDRARLDKYVIQNWSVWLDLYILLRTAKVVLTGRGAY